MTQAIWTAPRSAAELAMTAVMQTETSDYSDSAMDASDMAPPSERDRSGILKFPFSRFCMMQAFGRQTDAPRYGIISRNSLHLLSSTQPKNLRQIHNDGLGGDILVLHLRQQSNTSQTSNVSEQRFNVPLDTL